MPPFLRSYPQGMKLFLWDKTHYRIPVSPIYRDYTESYKSTSLLRGPSLLIFLFDCVPKEILNTLLERYRGIHSAEPL